MSLSKQLLLLVTLIFFLVFSINFALSIDNIRSYLQGESEVHAQDTATSLGLSLSPYMTDEQDPMLRTMMNAIFDTGYFSEMRLVNIDNVPLVVLNHPIQVEGVPDWLIKFFPITPATAVSEISSGWNISGELSVTSNPGYGYLKLYEQFKSTLLYSLLFFVLSIALLFIVLRLTLKPLRAIQQQANQIAAGHFKINDNLPITTEVREVALSMNGMSRKIGSMIARLNHKLLTLTDSLKRDPLTQLLNQDSFQNDLKEALETGKTSYLIYLKIDALSALVKNLGKQATDELLIAFADLLSAHSQPSKTPYRLMGSEFAILGDKQDISEIETFLINLHAAIEAFGHRYHHPDFVHIGVVAYERNSELSRLMTAAIEAYEQAKLIGPNAYFIKHDCASTRSAHEWHDLIEHVINQKQADITLRAKAYNYESSVPIVVMAEAFTQLYDENDTALSMATFFSMAVEFDLAEDLDKMLVDKILTQLEQSPPSYTVTINLAIQSANSYPFREWLTQRLQHFPLPKELLAFSVSSYAAAKSPEDFANFSHFIKKLGASTLLKRYHSDLIPIEHIRRLHVDYIRLARELTTDILQNNSKPDLLDIIREMTNLLEIKVLAESVSKDADFDYLHSAGLFGISR